MGLGALARDFFSSGSEKLAKTNRAYYKRSLFLFVACRSLPHPDPWDSSQRENLKKVFGSVQAAINHGTFAAEGSKDVDERFRRANINLETYLRIYHRGARYRSYMAKDDSLLTFEEAAQEDGWATKTLDDFSKTINEKVESMKRSPYRTIDITIWGPVPVGVAKGEKSLKPHCILVPYLIKIEETARIDTLLHRLLEYATLFDSLEDSFFVRNLGSLQLDMNPQIYDTSPVDVLQFERTQKIGCIKPWTTVADLDSNATLHIVPNRYSIFMRPVDLKSTSGFFYKPDRMAQTYTNAWPLTDRYGNRSGNSLAVRKRTASHSLHLLQENGEPTPLLSEAPPIGSRSSSTLVPTSPVPEPIVTPAPVIDRVLHSFPNRNESVFAKPGISSISVSTHSSESFVTAKEEFYDTSHQRSSRLRSQSSASKSSIYSDISNQTVPSSLSESNSISALDLANRSIYSRASSRTLSTDYGLFYTRHARSDEYF